MTKVYRVGIIGLSGIAAGAARPAPHPSLGTVTPYSHAAAYARFPQCRVEAVCDLSRERIDAFLKTWGDRWPGVKAYTNADEMFANHQLDILSVATPDHLHKPFVLAGCEAGVRAILCEKPLATTLADCDEMIAAVRRHGVKMNVDHTRRWIGSWQDARAAIDAGLIGEVKHVTGILGGPRAMMFRNGTHIVDIINFLARGTPIWVSAELEPGFEHFKEGYQGDGGHDPASEPGANAMIGYDNGVRATYIGMKGSMQDAGAVVYGTKGRINVDWSTESITLDVDGRQFTRPLQLSGVGMRHEYQYSGIAGAVADLIHALETGAETVSPPEEARKAVAVLLGMIESHFQQGRRVPIAPPPAYQQRAS